MELPKPSISSPTEPKTRFQSQKSPKFKSGSSRKTPLNSKSIPVAKLLPPSLVSHKTPAQPSPASPTPPQPASLSAQPRPAQPAQPRTRKTQPQIPAQPSLPAHQLRHQVQKGNLSKRSVKTFRSKPSVKTFLAPKHLTISVNPKHQTLNPEPNPFKGTL